MPVESGALGMSPALAGIARVLAIDGVTAEVVAALRRAGIDPILLRGPSVAGWLYPDGGRLYRDTDLLVPERAFGPAREVLAGLGFADWHAGYSALERPRHAAVYWRRPPGGWPFFVDLHKGLSPVAGRRAGTWELLRAGAEPLAVGGLAVLAPGVPARALLVAVHAAAHGVGCFQTMEDLRRVLAVTSEQEWLRAGALATRLGLDGALAAGLRLLPEGAGVAGRLGLPRRASPALRLASLPAHPPGIDALLSVAAAPSLPGKAAAIVRRAFPSAALLRHRHPAAPPGTRGLVLARLRHLGRCARFLVPALATWLRLCRGR